MQFAVEVTGERRGVRRGAAGYGLPRTARSPSAGRCPIAFRCRLLVTLTSRRPASGGSPRTACWAEPRCGDAAPRGARQRRAQYGRCSSGHQPRLARRAAGSPVDTQRLEASERLAHELDDRLPEITPNVPEDRQRRALLPFYEAYFSNLIEGTEFTLDEAAEIVFDGLVPTHRPADAHDVLSTYEGATATATAGRPPTQVNSTASSWRHAPPTPRPHPHFPARPLDREIECVYVLSERRPPCS